MKLIYFEKAEQETCFLKNRFSLILSTTTLTTSNLQWSQDEEWAACFIHKIHSQWLLIKLISNTKQQLLYNSRPQSGYSFFVCFLFFSEMNQINRTNWSEVISHIIRWVCATLSCFYMKCCLQLRFYSALANWKTNTT